MAPRHRQLVFAAAGLVVAAGVGGAAYLAADGSSDRPTGRPAGGGAAMAAVVYRSPTCGCCKSYEEYLRRHDIEVQSEVIDDLAPVKADHGVPDGAQSCHTTVIESYAVEGHVPMEAIEKLLEERPEIDGIAVPGMPANSPGMGEPDGQPLTVVSLDDGRVEPFMTL